MRSWVCAVALVVVAVSVECQRSNQQGSGSPTNTNTRLGLISSQLGVPPVPTGQTGNFVRPNNQPTGCYCLPVNQACPTSNPNTSGAGVFNVRIVNRPRPQGGICVDPEQKVCCLNGANIGNIPNPGPVNPGGPFPVNPGNPFPVNPVRPNPVVPSPIQIGTCGVSNPIPYKQAAFAEAQFGEYPWMAVVLDLANRYLGGGVLISPEWVLTAAHKVHNQQNMKVRLGEYDVKSTQDHPQYPHVELQIDRVIIHPAFNANTLANDIAILHLSQPINTQLYPHIGTACLPAQGQLFFSQTCWVTGWGQDAFSSSGRFQNILKEVDVPMVDPFACQARLRNSRLGQSFVLDTNSFVCAGGVAGKDACTGDGGAPLVCRSNRGWTVTGLVAWGIGCAQSEIPGVYVNVANYVNFIRQYVRV